MDLSSHHRETYDLAADEYEGRAESLRPVTEKVIKAIESFIQKDGKILDIGCGVGLAVEILSARQFQTAGIDISPKMVDHARRRNPSAEIIEGNFATYFFKDKFDGLLALAFIHLFPKTEAGKMLNKMRELLKPNGVLYIGTTKSSISSEGFYQKSDYQGKYQRFRKQWTKDEFEQTLADTGFKILKYIEIKDPYGKIWMDFIVNK